MREWNPGDDSGSWKQNLADWKQAEADAVAAQNAAQSAVRDAQQAVSYITAWIGSLTLAATATQARGAHLDALNADLAATGAAIAADTGAITDREQARDIATARLLGGPSSSLPVTLLPMSMHTSWAAGALRVRIYPDQISTTHHDPALTPAETTAAEPSIPIRAAAISRSFASVSKVRRTKPGSRGCTSNTPWLDWTVSAVMQVTA